MESKNFSKSQIGIDHVVPIHEFGHQGRPLVEGEHKE